MDEIALLKPCAMCPETVIYRGPEMLSNASVFCSETCARLWDAIAPGHWVNATELMQGGHYCDRPDIWTES